MQDNKKEWSVTTLYFHHVSPDIDYYTNNPPQIFEQQIKALASEFKFWTVKEAIEAYKQNISPDNHVVLTFDDGYQDNYTYARRILNKYKVKATFYILPSYVGKWNDWNVKCGYKSKHMDWKELKILLAEGHDIGSHGISHSRMDHMTEQEIIGEMQRSKEILEQNLDLKIQSFAYPFGAFNSNTSKISSEFHNFSFSTVKSDRKDWSQFSHSIRRIYIPQNMQASQIKSTVLSY